MCEVRRGIDGQNALLKLCLEWEEAILVDLGGTSNIDIPYHPSGSIHTQSGTSTNYTLRIHTNDVNHGHHMNIVDPCKVSIIATKNT